MSKPMGVRYMDYKPSIFSRIVELKEKYVGEKFLGWPDEWYEPYHVWCENGHLSSCVLKAEGRMPGGHTGDLCLACWMPVMLGPPNLEGIEPNMDDKRRSGE